MNMSWNPILKKRVILIINHHNITQLLVHLRLETNPSLEVVFKKYQDNNPRRNWRRNIQIHLEKRQLRRGNRIEIK